MDIEGDKLMNHCATGDLEALTCDIENGTCVNYTDRNGISLLHVASANGHDAIVEVLLAKGAMIDKCTNLGWTSLMHAARNKHFSVVKFLLNNGSNVLYKNRLGASVLNMAVAGGSAEVINAVLEALPENKITSGQDDVCPLFIAILYKHFDALELLLRNCNLNHQINISDQRGISPLMLAAASDLIDIAHLLLKHGADANNRNALNQTAFDIATEKKNNTLFNMLNKRANQERLLCSTSNTKSPKYGSDLFEHYGWSSHYSPQSRNTEHFPMCGGVLPHRPKEVCLGSPTCFENSPNKFLSSNFKYPPQSYALENNIQDITPGEAVVPVPPFSPYSNVTSDFSFPQTVLEKRNLFCENTSCDLNGNSKISANPCGDSYDKNTDGTAKEKIKVKRNSWWNRKFIRRLFSVLSIRTKHADKTSLQADKENETISTNTSTHTEISAKITSFTGNDQDSYLSYSPTPANFSLTSLLENLNLRKYIPSFIEHEVDIDSFLTLNVQDLVEIGVSSPESQNKLLKVITTFKGKV